MLNNGNGQPRKAAKLPQARAMDLVTRDVVDEVLVYDLKRHKAHCLNLTAALVWKNCDGNRTVADIATLLGENLNATVDEEAVWFAVERLGKAHLLQERVAPPTGSTRLSRREAVRRLGLGATLAIPVVMSIMAPTAVSAQTCVAAGMTGMCTSSTVNNCCTGCCSGSIVDACLATGLAMSMGCLVNCQCSSNMCTGLTCD